MSTPGPAATGDRLGPAALALGRVPDRLWVPGVAALVLAVLFVGALLVRADGDASLLVHAAPPWTTSDGAPDSLTVQEPGDDFDGQFFYRLGVAPWSTDETVAGVTYDLASLRNARWGYGAAAWLASGGNTDLVPWALVAVNVAAAAAIGVVGGALARSSGRHAVWGLLFVLWPGFAYSLSLDTSELLASAFALAGLLALRHHRWALATAALVAAVLTRDTTAVIAFGVLLAGAAHLVLPNLVHRRGATDHRPPRPGREPVALVVVGAVTMVAFGGWQLLQRARFGSLPLTSSGDNNLAAPLTGLFDLVGSHLPPSSSDEVFRLMCAAFVVYLVTMAGWALWSGCRATAGDRSEERATTGAVGAGAVGAGTDGGAGGGRVPETLGPRFGWEPRAAVYTAEVTAWLGSVAVVVLLNAYLWSGATAFMRAGTEAGILSVLVIVGARPAPRSRLPVVGAALAGIWALTAMAQFLKLP